MKKNTRFLSLLAIAAMATPVAFAQDAPKVLAGAKQYKTWSVGITGGALMPMVVTGGGPALRSWTSDLGYGLFVKKQLAPSFALKLDAHRGTLNARPTDIAGDPGNLATTLQYVAALKGVMNVGTVSFLKRKKALGFFVQAGYGFAGAGAIKMPAGIAKPADQGTERTTQFIPVGLGMNVKLGRVVDLVMGYDMNFSMGSNMFTGNTGLSSNPKDKWSYGYAGLEFHLGKKQKPSLQWTNPIALLYDELKDSDVSKEIAGLQEKSKVLDSRVAGLYKDSDGDGVSDVFDKEPNTPAGTASDGAGRAIVFPKPAVGSKPSLDGAATKPSTSGDAGSEGVLGSIGGFKQGKSEINLPQAGTLDGLIDELKKANSIIIEGYTSSEGDKAFNENLSKLRAEAVKKFFVDKGVTASSIETIGKGTADPIAPNDTKKGRSQNRRAVIKTKK